MQKVAKKLPNKKRAAASGKPKARLEKIGRDLGSLFGPTGAILGGMAGRAISRITGMGDYKVQGNTLIGGQAPQFISTTSGMRICHREYVTDIKSSSEFSNAYQYFINPGNSTLFKWLSGVATNFESYELHGLVFTYKPTSGTAISSTSAAMGSVILSTEYDVLKPIFNNKQEAEAYMFTTVSVPYSGMMHPVECKPSLTVLPKKFITPSTTPSGLKSDDDPRLHYHGLTQVMTAGQQSNSSVIGELWVSYDVTLFTPRPSSEGNNTCFAIAQYTGVSQSNIVPDAAFNRIYRSSHCDISPNATNGSRYTAKCTFNRPGLYLLEAVSCWDSVGASLNIEYTGFMSGSSGFQSVVYDPSVSGPPVPYFLSSYSNAVGSGQNTNSRYIVNIIDPTKCYFVFSTCTLSFGVSSSTFNVGYSSTYIGLHETRLTSSLSLLSKEPEQGEAVGTVSGPAANDYINVNSKDASYVSLANLRPTLPGGYKSVNER